MQLIKHVLDSECALNRKGLDIEGGAIECVHHILKVSRSSKSTLWRASFKDITSIRAFGILYYENSSYLRERKNRASAISIASLNFVTSIIARTNVRVMYGY